MRKAAAVIKTSSTYIVMLCIQLVWLTPVFLRYSDICKRGIFILTKYTWLCFELIELFRRRTWTEELKITRMVIIDVPKTTTKFENFMPY